MLGYARLTCANARVLAAYPRALGLWGVRIG